MKAIFVYSRGWAPAPRQQEGETMDQKASAKVLVLDFGAQYGQLIARRVRDLNVYSEIVPCDISADEIREMNASALILSGGPASVYAEDAPSIDPAIFDLGLPVLGFCYGHQITAVTLGGKVGHSEVGEYGRATITRTAGAKLFNSTPMEQTVWMSHRDAVSEVPEGFTVTASTDVCPVAAMECVERKIFTTQFHPEVKHSEYGQQLLSNFLFEICGLEPNWSMDNLVETMTAEFREKVGDDRVILALSGGVDSSVSAYLLLQQGYKVEGLFMKNWEEDDGEEYCTAAADLADAQAVCDKLGIELHTVNFAAEYWDNVFELFLEEYKAGRTPNPDILCNKEIKFKAFLEFAAEDLGADYIATGHYVRRADVDGKSQLLRGLDGNKDQSYFLYTLSHEQIAQSLFPVGELEKPQVRKIAEELDLITAKKKDSTGICFIGERKFRDFLGRYLPAQPGKILTVDGEEIGTHQGLMYHTLGQRKGLGIGGTKEGSEDPWYVVDKDVENNILIVAQGHDHPRLMSVGLIAQQLHWVNREPLQGTLRCTVKTRYRQTDIPCTVTALDEDRIEVRFDEPVAAVTPGQSAVFYLGEVCLGGGIIEQRLPLQS